MLKEKRREEKSGKVKRREYERGAVEEGEEGRRKEGWERRKGGEEERSRDIANVLA